MNDPTHNTFGTDDMAGEKGVSSIVFTVVICTIVIIILGAAAYVVISDRLNGNDAYRTKQLRDQRDGYKTTCEENYKTNSVLYEWIKQNNIKPPPEFVVQKVCTQPAAVESDQH